MKTTKQVLGSLAMVCVLAGCGSSSNSSSGAGGSGGDPNNAITYYRVLVHGKLADPANAQALHDMLAKSEQTTALAKSETSHATFLGLQDPTDFLGVDTWSNLDDLNRYYADPGVQKAWAPLLAAAPEVVIWEHPANWVEWGAITPEYLQAPIFAFRIRGHLSGATTEASRETHNMVAGGASKDKAISLGDHAHNVHLRADDPAELLFLDLWVDPMKAQQQFFSDPQTIMGAQELFSAPLDVVVYGLSGWYQW